MPSFGFVPITHEFDDIREEAQLAESLGLDGCYFVEHHQQPGIVASPLTLAAAVAAVTERITIGTGIIVLPLYHPVHVAEDCATIDRISRGRFVLGVGLGYQAVDFGAFDVPIRQRVSLFEESVEVIRRLWTEDNVSFAGKRYRLDKVRLYPKPLQDPHPPIWLAGAAEEAVKRAARLGDAWLAD
ncbi:MAG TPA: LLM class flavin-dependent oxidoreductase, partial [Dehalococcoidia bacterium]|nr:LLM class flavin-dependent oxidoreductase [Dehalococcoidia bacterium]